MDEHAAARWTAQAASRTKPAKQPSVKVENCIPEDRCVIVVTGPIGYGKSRFIRRHLLPALHKQKRKVALLEHRFSSEFGQHARQPSKELAFPEATANVFDFGGGCVCCSPKGDVERRTRELMAVAIKKKTPIDTIVLETTGVADPLVFAECCPRAFNARKALVVCVCLAKEEAPCEELASVLKRQIDVSTVVVSRRTMSAKASEETEAVARILRAINSPTLERPKWDGPKVLDYKDPFSRYPDLSEEKALIHDKKVESYVLMAPGKVDVEKTEDVLHSLSRKRGVLRVKVACKLHGDSRGLFLEDKHGGFLIGESSPFGVTSKHVEEVEDHERLGDFCPGDPGRCFVVTTIDADVSPAQMTDAWRNCQAPKNYQWLCDSELEFSNGQRICEAKRGATKLAVTFHRVQGRYLVVPALLKCGCDLTAQRVVEDDDGWRATCACGTVVDLLALMPGIAHCQGASFELYVAREGYEPRRQKSFAELVQNTGLTDEERAVRAAKQKELDDVIAGVGEELLDEGPQRQPGFQEIVEVLRKFIPEEQRPWDSVDYEPAPEGAPFPEVPPGHVLDRPIYEEVHEPSIPPNVPDDVVPPPPVLNWESRVFRDLRTEYHDPIDHASAERLFPGPPPQSFEEAHIDPAPPVKKAPPTCPLSLMEPSEFAVSVIDEVAEPDPAVLKAEAEAWRAREARRHGGAASPLPSPAAYHAEPSPEPSPEASPPRPPTPLPSPAAYRAEPSPEASPPRPPTPSPVDAATPPPTPPPADAADAPTPPPADAAPTPSPPAPAPAPTPAFEYSRFDKLQVSDSEDERAEAAEAFVDDVLSEGRALFSDGRGPPTPPNAAAVQELAERVLAASTPPAAPTFGAGRTGPPTPPVPTPAPVPRARRRARAPAPARARALAAALAPEAVDLEFGDDGNSFVGVVGAPPAPAPATPRANFEFDDDVSDTCSEEDLAPPALTAAQVEAFRVVDLKKELAARGLKTSGLKAVLKARLLAFLSGGR